MKDTQPARENPYAQKKKLITNLIHVDVVDYK